MCHCQSIIPPYISEAIINSPHVAEHIKHIHRLTLERTASIQEARLNFRGHVHAGGPLGHFIPPHVHQHIEMNNELSDELRDAAARTLETDAQFRADAQAAATEEEPSASVAAAAPQQSRTVYDFQHSWNKPALPGTVILIDEGGKPVSAQQDPSGDANEAYENLKVTWDFYYQLFQRNSIDGRGLRLIASVHFGDKYQNAYWNGRQMVFGDGDGVIFTQFTAFLDVVAHELTHGVISSTSNLTYSFESGALNESLADVFGIQVKQWKANQTNPATADWIIGNGIWGPQIKGRGLRDMTAPGTAFNDPMVGKDQQVGNMADWLVLPNTQAGDWGGVHLNSGIPSRAFYLASVKIGKATWEGAGPIWYRAMVDRALRANAKFVDFARITVGHAGQYAVQVTAAWNEVGVVV